MINFRTRYIMWRSRIQATAWKWFSPSPYFYHRIISDNNTSGDKQRCNKLASSVYVIAISQIWNCQSLTHSFALLRCLIVISFFVPDTMVLSPFLRAVKAFRGRWQNLFTLWKALREAFYLINNQHCQRQNGTQGIDSINLNSFGLNWSWATVCFKGLKHGRQ